MIKIQFSLINTSTELVVFKELKSTLVTLSLDSRPGGGGIELFVLNDHDCSELIKFLQQHLKELK